MEVAPGGSGGQQVSGPTGADDARRVRLNLVLYVVALLAAAVTVVVAVAVVGEVRDDPSPALPGDDTVEPVALEEAESEEQERLAAVITSARDQVDAFMNIRYDDVQATFDAVLAGATGAFQDQYRSASGDLAAEMRKQRSVQESEVLWTGIVAADPDSATVAAAVSSTVSNKSLGDKPSPRTYRLVLELVLEDDGVWRTRDMQFVA